MSWLLASLYDRFMQANETLFLSAWRKELFQGLAGDVLEVGAGTGANLPHYPSAVTRLVLTEPDANMLRKLRDKQAVSGYGHVLLSDASLEKLPMEDGSFDAVVCTLVLCSVPHQATALAEIFRVLKPGGRFLFLEHVRTDDPKRYRRHRWIEPFWKRMAGNCHLTRQTEDAILKAGFKVEEMQRGDMPQREPFVINSVRGAARKPMTQPLKSQ